MALKLAGSTSGFVALDAPASAGSNTLVLPADNGSNGEFLKTNGSGTLDWAGGGKILQVVKGTALTAIKYDSSTTFTNMSDTLPSVTITPALQVLKSSLLLQGIFTATMLEILGMQH